MHINDDQGYHAPAVNVSRISQKLVLTQPHTVENQGMSMAPLVLRLTS